MVLSEHAAAPRVAVPSWNEDQVAECGSLRCARAIVHVAEERLRDAVRAMKLAAELASLTRDDRDEDRAHELLDDLQIVSKWHVLCSSRLIDLELKRDEEVEHKRLRKLTGIGSKGGIARAASLSPARRSEIASKAARARHGTIKLTD